jgi:hypothetical protein
MSELANLWQKKLRNEKAGLALVELALVKPVNHWSTQLTTDH